MVKVIWFILTRLSPHTKTIILKKGQNSPCRILLNMFKILKNSKWLFLGVMLWMAFLFCIFMYFPHFLQWACIFLKIREHISSKGELKTVCLWHINPGARGSTFNELGFSIPYSGFLHCACGIEIVCLKKQQETGFF